MRTLADHTAHDVTAEDQAQYATHVERWQNDLHPNGALECYFAAEIARAASLRYRNQTNAGIRRNLEELRRIQSNRYLQAHLGFLLPGVATLTGPNLKLILSGLKSTGTQADPAPESVPKSAKQPEKVDPAAVADSETALHSRIQDEERRLFTEFAKRDLPADPEVRPVTPPVTVSPKPAAPRNALCPCNSGQKYKRCCGHWSKTNLRDAA